MGHAGKGKDLCRDEDEHHGNGLEMGQISVPMQTSSVQHGSDVHWLVK